MIKPIDLDYNTSTLHDPEMVDALAALIKKSIPKRPITNLISYSIRANIAIVRAQDKGETDADIHG